MIDIEELRRLAQKETPGLWIVNASAVTELLDRIEAAEKVSLALCAKIEQMKKYEQSVPEKVEVREDEGMIFSSGSYNEGYDNGWNDCIDALLTSAPKQDGE